VVGAIAPRPVLLIHNEADPIVPAEGARRLAAAISSSAMDHRRARLGGRSRPVRHARPVLQAQPRGVREAGHRLLRSHLRQTAGM